MGYIAKCSFLVFFAAFFQLGTCNFFMNVQKVYDQFQYTNGTNISATIFSGVGNLNNINDTGPYLIFNVAFSAISSNTTTGGCSNLCEQAANLSMFGNYTCPCEWYLIGSYCYQFQYNAPAYQCSGGWLAEQFGNIFNHTAAFYYAKFCGDGFVWIGQICLSTIQPAKSWVDAENTCMGQVGGQANGPNQCVWPNCNHLPTVDLGPWYQNFAIFQTTMSTRICNVPNDMWLGYNSYSWNNPSYYTSTTYEVVGPWTVSGNGTCVAFNKLTGQKYLDDCNQPKQFVCTSTSLTSDCPNTWHYIPPYCYKILTTAGSMDFTSSAAACQNEYPKSTLLSIHSQTEWNYFTGYRTAFVNLQATNGSRDFEDIYIGYQLQSATSQWQYLDQTLSPYSDSWNPGSPNASATYPQCAVSSKSTDYAWVNSDCTTSRGVACKGPNKNNCTDPSYTYLNGQCYKYMNVSATTWSDAARICNADGATLPIFPTGYFIFSYSHAYWDMFQTWRLSLTVPNDYIWIGLTQFATAFFTPPLFVWADPTYDETFASLPLLTPGQNTTDPYVVSSKFNYTWSLANATFTANVICHLKKIEPQSCGCPSNNWYVMPCDNAQPPTCYSCYLPINNTMSFPQAEGLCQSFGNRTNTSQYTSHIIDYPTTNYWARYANLHYLFMAMLYPVDDAWVGYSRGPSNPNGPWVANRLGEPDAPSSIWATGQPSGPITGNKNYCAFRSHSQQMRYGNLSDADCSTSLGVVCNITKTLPTSCPPSYVKYSYNSGNDICYKLFNNSTSFSAASATCANDNGSLPSFHSFGEYQDFLRFRWRYMNLNYHTLDQVWIGLKQSNFTVVPWQWTDKTNYNYSSWYKGKPQMNNNLCVMSDVTIPDRNNMSWIDVNCNGPLTFICQIRKPKLTDPCPGLSLAGKKCYALVTTQPPVKQSDADAYCKSLGLSLPVFPSASTWNSFLDWLGNMNQAAKWTKSDKKWPIQQFWIGLTVYYNLEYWTDGSFSNFTPSPLSSPPWYNDANCYFADDTTSNFTWKNPTGRYSNPKSCCHDHSRYPSCSAVQVDSIVCQNSVIANSSCPQNFYSYGNNICYSVSVQAGNITGAQSFCSSMNASLSTFHTDQEWQDFLAHRQLLIDLSVITDTVSLWIGLHDSSPPFTWQWINNMSYNYSQWIPYTEPSNDTTKTCVVTEPSTVYWLRSNCTDFTPVAICQTRPIQSTVFTEVAATPWQKVTCHPEYLLVCKLGWSDVNGNGICVKIVPTVTNVTRDQANLYCKSIGGTLPYFVALSDWMTFTEWKMNFGTAAGLYTTDIWLGLMQIGVGWTLPNNSLATFFAWDSSMPQNNSQINCVASVVNSSYNWINLDCKTPTVQSLICQQDFNPSNPCPPAYGQWLEIGGICYTGFNNTLYNQNQSVSQCAHASAYLPSFHNSYECWLGINNGYLNVYQSVWVGLSDPTFQLHWQWSDKTNYNWSYWNPGIEPNNNVNDNCVTATGTVNNYFWNRQNCSSFAALICQLRLHPLNSSCLLGWSDVNNDGNCYQIIPGAQDVSFDQATLLCRSIGGALPCFANAIDWNNFLGWRSNFGTARNYNTTDFWIGLVPTPGATAATWRWLDGTTFGFTFWDTTMPKIVPPFDQVASVDSASSRWQNFDSSNPSTMASVICKQHNFPSSCGLGWFQMNGVCYATTLSNNSFIGKTAATNSCSLIGGSLPSFHFDGEWHDFLSYIWLLSVRLSYNTNSSIWIGLDDTVQPLLWKWSDGTNYNWSNWKSGVEPSLAVKNNCVISVSGDGYQWNRQDCNASASFVCQKRLNKTLSKCTDGWSDVHGDGNCYQIRPEATNLTYSQALLYCQSLNGTLPCFGNAFDFNNFQTWKFNFGTANKMNTTDFWLGLTNPDPNFVNWQWIDGTPFANFTLWNQQSTPNPNPAPGYSCAASIAAEADHWQNFDCSSPPPMASLICKESNTTSLCSPGWFQLNSVCYMTAASNSTGTNIGGYNFCANLGGNLPSFHNDQEWTDFLSYLWLSSVRFGSNSVNGVWIGLNDTDQPFVWTWTDGTNYNWTNWDSGVQPTLNITQNCVVAATNQTGQYVWRRQFCNATATVICQNRLNKSISKCDLGWSDVHGDGNCYQIRSEVSNVTFSQALLYCQSLNGTLPCFNNVTDWNNFQNWRYNFARARVMNTSNFWIGLTNPDSNFTHWQWVEDGSNNSFFLPVAGSLNPVPSTPVGNCVASMNSYSNLWLNSDCSSGMQSLICKEHYYVSQCGDGWFEMNGVCYLTIQAGSVGNRQTSVRNCQKNGGTLPTFHNVTEYDDFNAYIWLSQTRYGLRPDLGIRIGLSDMNSSYVWQWIDKSTYDWNQWEIGVEPSANINQSCVISVQLNNGQYVWRRQYCNANASFVCQKRLQPTPASKCLPGWTEVNQGCFKIWPRITNLNFDQISDFCQLNGGVLPTFASETDYINFLNWKLNADRARNFNTSTFWVSSVTKSTFWTWAADSTPFPFIDLIPTFQPNPDNKICLSANDSLLYNLTTVDCVSTDVSTVICMHNNKSTPVSSNCTSPWIERNNICYNSLANLQSFSSASAAQQGCQNYSLSANLPSFHSQNEWDSFTALRWYFASLASPDNNLQSVGVWIGTQDYNGQLTFQNMDKSNFNWLFWLPHQQPINVSAPNCVASPSLNTGVGEWITDSCSASYAAICQYRQQPLNDTCEIPGWSSIGNRCYKIISVGSPADIGLANNSCNAINATLPSFSDQNQWDEFLDWKENFYMGKSLETYDVWLGASRTNNGTNWQWTDHNETMFNWTNFDNSVVPSNGSNLNLAICTNLETNDSWKITAPQIKLPERVICQLIQYPVDCQISEWVNWTCSATCGEAKIKRTRNIEQQMLNGGQPCPTDLLDYLECDYIPCPIDCLLSDWSEWTECSCATQTRFRNHTILVDAEYGGRTCAPPKNETGDCDDYDKCFPMSPSERLVASILQGLGCSVLIGCCAFTVAACLAFKIFNLERMLHMGQEISLIITHIIIWTLRQYVINKGVCTVAAVVIQLGTLSTFAFMLLESIQVYSYSTNVIDTENLYDWQCNLVLATLPPLAVTMASTALFYHHYYARWSCWLNVGHMVSFATILPVIACAAATFVILEAAGQGLHAMLPLSDETKYYSNKVNQRGLLFILPLNLGAWFMGLTAVYFQWIAIYPIVLGFNVALGITIVVFHALSHAAVFLWAKRVLTKIGIIKPEKLKPTVNLTLEQKPNQNVLQFSENTAVVSNSEHGIKPEQPVGNSQPNASTEKDPQDVRPNEQNAEAAPDIFKDHKAYYRWIMDGRHDNMNESGNLLF